MGRYEAIWNGRDDTGGKVAIRTYFYHLEVGDISETKRMLLLRKIRLMQPLVIVLRLCCQGVEFLALAGWLTILPPPRSCHNRWHDPQRVIRFSGLLSPPRLRGTM